MHAVHRCGLLVHMSHVAWSACLSVCLCVGHTGQLCKTIEMPFGGLTRSRGSKELDASQDRTNPFAAARGDKTAMRPFAKLLWTILFLLLP